LSHIVPARHSGQINSTRKRQSNARLVYENDDDRLISTGCFSGT